MASAPIITFPDVEAVVSCHVTRSHGVTPNAIMLNIAPQTTPIRSVGDLRVQYEGVDFTLRDCLVDARSYQFDSQQRIVTLIIFDRRWRWRYKIIDGHYNRRNESGEIIFAGPESPQVPALDTIRDTFQLAVRLLEGMGESNYDVAAVPHDLYPEVEWYAANPAEELERLCDLLRLRVILKWDDTITILPIALAENLPEDKPLIRVSTAVDPKERPEAIGIVCSPTVYQMDFELEAVGEDESGAIRWIDFIAQALPLPHRPREDAWGHYFTPHKGFSFEFANDEQDKRLTELANATIFKWYRIKLPFVYPATAETESFTIEAMEEIVPILSHQVRTTLEDGRLVNMRPIVYGEWFKADKEDDRGNTLLTALPDDVAQPDLPVDLIKAHESIVPGGYGINEKKGIVEFSSPIYRIAGTGVFDAAGKEHTIPRAAILRLRASFHRRVATGVWNYAVIIRPQSPPVIPGEILHVKRPELFVAQRVQYIDGSFADTTMRTNTIAVETVANRYIDAIERDFQTSLPTMAEYAGLHMFELSGSIRTIEFSLDSSGASAISTTIHRDQDEAGAGNLSYEELRSERRLRTLSGFFPPLSAADRRRIYREMPR